MDWLDAAVTLGSGLLGASSSKEGTTTTSERKLDPRMDRYVYGADGNSGLLGSAFDLTQQQLKTGGLNDLQRQGLDMQRQYLMSPQYQQGFSGMMGLGQQLMGGGVAGNPFNRSQGVGSDAYFAQNPDVADAYTKDNYGMDRAKFAQTHFDKFGQSEGRKWGGAGGIRLTLA